VSGFQRYCSTCGPINEAEKAKAEHARWSLEHPKAAKNWQKENPEKVKAANVAWRERNLEKSKAYSKAYYSVYFRAHPEQTRKQHFKRRDLGFVPLNAFFPNSEAHHIDSQFVIYIPKELHKSISHCLKTGRNMAEINAEAFNFL